LLFEHLNRNVYIAVEEKIGTDRKSRIEISKLRIYFSIIALKEFAAPYRFASERRASGGGAGARQAGRQEPGEERTYHRGAGRRGAVGYPFESFGITRMIVSSESFGPPLSWFKGSGASLLSS
jgi:hypothetical protein